MKQNKPIIDPRDITLIHNLTNRVLDNLKNEQIGIADLVPEPGNNRSQFHRKLKLLKGKSISQYFRDIRLEEAIGFNINDIGTVSKIAYSVGFGSPAYFSPYFHKRFEITTGGFNKRILNEGIESFFRDISISRILILLKDILFYPVGKLLFIYFRWLYYP